MGDGQIDERGMHAAVTEISRKIGETILRINSFAIPFDHAMNDESMTSIVNPGPDATAPLFQTGVAKD